MQVTVEFGLSAVLVRHAWAAMPREACGLLGVSDPNGDEIRIHRFVPTTNTAPGPDRFAIDPTEVARAESRLRADGLRLGATFHSHPEGLAVPSDTDRESCWPGFVHLILGLGPDQQDGQLTAWAHTDGQLQQLPLQSLASPEPVAGPLP